MKTCKVFISAFKKDLSEKENIKRHNQLCEYATKEGLLFDQCLGVYEGVKELSILIYFHSQNKPYIGNIYDYIHNLIDKYDQDCALLVCDDNRSYLVNNDYTVNHIGTMHSTSYAPLGVKDYSYVINQCVYYYIDNGVN